MSTLNDKKKQVVIGQKTVKKIVAPTQITKKSVSVGGASNKAKSRAKKDNAKFKAGKPVAAKSSATNVRKKPIKAKTKTAKPAQKRIADKIKPLSSKRVWPD